MAHQAALQESTAKQSGAHGLVLQSKPVDQVLFSLDCCGFCLVGCGGGDFSFLKSVVVRQHEVIY